MAVGCAGSDLLTIRGWETQYHSGQNAIRVSQLVKFRQLAIRVWRSYLILTDFPQGVPGLHNVQPEVAIGLMTAPIAGSGENVANFVPVKRRQCSAKGIRPAGKANGWLLLLLDVRAELELKDKFL